MTPNIHELVYLGLIFGLLVFPRALQRFRIPAPLTCLLLGVLTAIIFNVRSDATLSLLAIIGISSLFLFAGLEIDFKDLARNSRQLTYYLLTTFLLLALCMAVCMHFFEFPWQASALISLALFIPSTGFILETLSGFDLTKDEKLWITQKAIASELVALVILFVVLQADSANILAISTLKLLAIILVLPLLFIALGKIILPHAPGSEFSLLIMTGIIAAYCTKQIGVYYLVGAFVTGIIARQLRVRLPELASNENLHAVKLFTSFFIPFYFFYSGITFPENALHLQALLIGIGITAVVMPLRIGFIWLQRYASTVESDISRTNVSLALAPTLIFTLVIAGIMHYRGYITDILYGALLVYASISTLVPSLIMQRKLNKPAAAIETQAPTKEPTKNSPLNGDTMKTVDTAKNNPPKDSTSTSNKEDVLGFMKDHIKRYLATDGKDGHMMNGFPCLVLNTTGAKSGEPRQAAVIYGKHDNNHVIVASKGGSDTPPAWFANLEANPFAKIQVKAEKIAVKMRVAEGSEREQLWDMMAKVFPDYLDYQKKTTRQIAVCVLEPV